MEEEFITADTKDKSTVEALDEIERKIGGEEFRRIFITLTCDEVSQFMDIEGIECSCIDSKPRRKFFLRSPLHSLREGTQREPQQDSQAVLSKELRFLKGYGRGSRSHRITGRTTTQGGFMTGTPAMIFTSCFIS